MRFFNNFLTGLAIVLLLLTGFVSYKDIPVWKLFLFKDFNSIDLSVLLNKEQNSMGQISELSGNGLKRRTLTEGFFKNVHLNDQVFSGDVLITDSTTKAVLKFTDGSILSIDPGSMVKLDFHTDKTGLLNIAKNPKVEVLTGSVTGTGGAKDLKITNAQGQNLTVAAHSTNKVQVAPKETAPVKINSDRLTKLNLPLPAPKPIEVKPVPVQQAEVKPEIFSPPVMPKTDFVQKDPPRRIASIPENASMGILDIETPKIAGLKGLSSNIYQGEDIRSFFVDLKWEALQSATGYNLELFLDRGLTKPWFNVQTENNYYRITQLINGTVYYQVTALHNKKAIGKTKSQSLTFNYNGPELKNPKSGTQLDSAEGVYYFTWEKTNFTDKYILEISKTPEFTKIVKKESDSNFIQIPLISGVYYWRVSSKLGEVISKPSKTNPLVIK